MKRLIPLVLSVIAGTGTANAGSYSQQLNLTATGTVIITGQCTFGDSGTVSVTFKDVALRKSSSDTYILDKDYIQTLTTMSCTGDSAGLQMRLTTAAGSYQTLNGIKVLPTNNSLVGVQLLVNGVAQNAGDWFDIASGSRPVLQAKLIQLSETGSAKTGDTFSASATLQMAFN